MLAYSEGLFRHVGVLENLKRHSPEFFERWRRWTAALFGSAALCAGSLRESPAQPRSRTGVNALLPLRFRPACSSGASPPVSRYPSYKSATASGAFTFVSLVPEGSAKRNHTAIAHSLSGGKINPQCIAL